MGTRQRSRSSKQTPQPVISGNQLSGTSGTSEASARGQDDAILRASFDPSPFENTRAGALDEPQSLEPQDVPKATFIGEQIVYKDRDARIAEAAYLRAEARGFEPGYELEDWLAAEREIDATLGSPDANLDAR